MYENVKNDAIFSFKTFSSFVKRFAGKVDLYGFCFKKLINYILIIYICKLYFNIYYIYNFFINY